MNKELFISSIDALREQADYDSKLADALSEAYSSFVGTYNNGKLFNQTILLLRDATNAPFHEELNMCDIEYFCYELDFGRKYIKGSVIGSSGQIVPLATTEDLWNLLNRIGIAQECVATGDASSNAAGTQKTDE